MSHRLLFPLFIFLCVVQNSLVAEDFRIESTPPGATVEIEGKVVGTTPYTWAKLPGGYFHKTRSVFGGWPTFAVLAKVGICACIADLISSLPH